MQPAGASVPRSTVPVVRTTVFPAKSAWGLPDQVLVLADRQVVFADGQGIVDLAGTGTLIRRPLPLPKGYSGGYLVNGLATDRHGNVWFNAEGLFGVVPPKGAVRVFDATNSAFVTVTGTGLPFKTIALGADGRMWFAVPCTVQRSNGDCANRAAIDAATSTGKVSIYHVPFSYRVPDNLIAGPNHEVWFTESGDPGRDSAIAAMTTNGRVHEYLLPKSLGAPYDLVTAGGDIWFTLPGTGHIGRLTAQGKLSVFAAPRLVEGAYLQYPAVLAVSPGGIVTFTSFNSESLLDGRFALLVGTISPAGRFSFVALPAVPRFSESPNSGSIAFDRSGQLLLTSQQPDALYRVDLAL